VCLARVCTIRLPRTLGFPELSASPRVVLASFREEHGYEASNKQFIAWYKRTHPEDYAKLF
jgi:hypothetical protein